MGLAVVHQNLGEHEAALILYEQVLETQVRCLGTGHGSVADTKVNIGIVYNNKGDQVAAKLCYKEAYEIYLVPLGRDHPKTQNPVPFI